MKMIKMALLGGAAIAVSAAAAQADDLDALKAQIESLNARVAAMEAAPSVPAGYSLLTISEGEMKQTPGLEMSARDRALYGTKSTVISVLPTADAPAGTTITWSGFARAGLVYSDTSVENEIKLSARNDGDNGWTSIEEVTFGEDGPSIRFPIDIDTDDDDTDVKARGQIRVQATTDTAVGEVGVDVRLRGNFNGNGNADVYMDVAWGYWSMTPELTFGGGYAGSLGDIGYGYDGACTCHYTDNADLAFNPGDVTQMRLSYGSGPFSMAIALEDAGVRDSGFGADDTINGDKLGAAGEIKYSGDMFSGEISGVWRDADEDKTGADSLWQVGAGVGFALGDIANFSIAAAMGEGPATTVDEGEIVDGIPYDQSYWGVTALASMKLSDEIHAELGAGYKKREGDDFDVVKDSVLGADWSSDGVEYDTYGVLGGIYYTPVDQLTIGVEAEWFTTSASIEVESTNALTNFDQTKAEIERDTDNFSIDLVSVWRF